MTQSNASSDAFNDSLNFVKKLWGQMSVPGMGMAGAQGVTIPGLPTMPLPTMSLEDLDKRIQELKTVETWLNVNMTMLRNTIQALEVQRATIATLHSLSSTMAKTMQDMGSDATHAFTSRDSAAADSAESDDGDDAGAAPDSAGAAEASPLIAQSAAWWQGVQDQFKQALGTALEKSTANYEAARSASENLVKATTRSAVPKSTPTPAKPKARSTAKATRKTPAAKTARRPAARPKTATKG